MIFSRARLVLAASLLISGIAQAQSAAVQSYNPIITGAGGFFPSSYASGFFFTTTSSSVSVSALGYFDPSSSSPGCSTDWTAMLVLAAVDGSPTTVASANCAGSFAGATDPIGGQFYYTALSSSYTLLANTSYAILVSSTNGHAVRSVFSGSSPLGVLDPALTYNGLAEIDPGCTIVSRRSDPSGPCGIHDAQGPWSGASFLLGTSAPEPSTFVLLATGFVGLVGVARRRGKERQL